MKKRIFMVYFALVLLFFPVSPVFAAEDAPRLVDGADLLTDSEETALRDKLDEISERQQVDLVIVTTDSLEGKSPMEFADDFYDYNGYGFGDSYDGVLFLISMEERDWHISTTGFGITAITDAGREYISENFLEDLSDGEYGAAFTTFAELCDAFITQAREGQPYDVGNLQLVKQQRCEQNYDQYDEEYQYRISHQGQSRFKHHNCGSIFFTVTKLNIFSQ